MKKTFLIITAALLLSVPARAQTVGYIDEVKTLGYIAGQGMACGASKFQTFEMLARAILITKAPSNKMQAKAMYAYNNAKADGYFAKQADGFFECDDINRRFDDQPIYQATLYADGSIKMPDGKIFTPRQPYDATLLYQDRNDRMNAQKIYDRGKKVKVGKITVENDSSAAGTSAEATAGTGRSRDRTHPASIKKKLIKQTTIKREIRRIFKWHLTSMFTSCRI